ncbi:transcriptional regulator with AbiEi antitoxin N-terminal domain [Chitinophaga costaii]|uniref:Transcriptional regulator with AbiEi antitoxin N-terminal domain n=1 Tax=Chitinophaga costaii TaxID=1335309 RepID=A0A1C3ZXD5_9BACT|nr:type IV toxin-antitoxin system AbiEi family antitoxin [Chitinophaga costaii]PUZ30543.1 hypothetical protein DCM91_03505 [Chitinophaga costaii]SCB87013.1 transcriptional regulator with AbiEi antitoxin N-terminal domain [Chitinophaga costaii]
MSTENESKINKLFSLQPAGVVLQSDWLVKQGYSHDLQQRYKKSNWLRSIGTGAVVRTNDQVGYEGAIYAIQVQSSASIHPGARTALSLLGKAHYLEFSQQRVVLFGSNIEKLPTWFKKRDWQVKIEFHQTSFLPSELGLTTVESKNLPIKVSGPARAILECLYLAPQKQDLIECYELMEGLNNLSPQRVQMLLEACQSIKVKRLFLYMAEKAMHQWFNYLNLEKIDLGSGTRSIVKNGAYIDKYKITVPKELEQDASNI